MESKDILYSKGKNDECFTPDYAVIPLLKYIPKDKIIWCPFDEEDDSEFVRIFRENGFEVISSHISEGKDFFEYEPERWDILISNPPFTNKRKYFERALSFNRPFALLMTNTIFNDKYPLWSFQELGKQAQILKFDKRIKYLNNGVVENKITFSSGYYCWNFLPKDFIQEQIFS